MTRIISKQQALEIARRQLSPAGQSLMDAGSLSARQQVTDKPDPPVGIYRTWEDEPVWYIYVPWDDGLDGRSIRSSRVMLISKKNGRVVYDGSAGNEG